MDKGIFTDREKAMEANYFRQQDAKLLERLRKDSSLDEIALALAEKLQIDNPDLLARVRALGVTADTAPAFFAAPLVQVAWAEGSVSKREQEAVLHLARERGIEEGSPAYAQLGEWLAARPADALFDTAVEVIKADPIPDIVAGEGPFEACLQPRVGALAAVIVSAAVQPGKIPSFDAGNGDEPSLRLTRHLGRWRRLRRPHQVSAVRWF